MWITAGIITVIAVGIYAYLAFTCYFTSVTFITAYRIEHEQSGSHESGVRAGLRVFQERPPVNVWSRAELEAVVRVLTGVSDYRAVAEIVRSIDRGRVNPRRMKDESFLLALEPEWKGVNGSQQD